MSNLANNTVTMEEILELVNSLPEGGGDPIVEYTNGRVTEIPAYTWAYFPYDVYVTYSSVVTVGERAFQLFSKLKSIDLPVATSIGDYAFVTSAALESINVPAVQSIGYNAFQNSALPKIVLPAATIIGERAFYNCSKLVTVDLHVAATISARSFYGCSRMSALIIRSATMCVAESDSLTSSAVARGTGYIYVPAALVDTYKADSVWSTYAAQFRALESYTVDGTTTGALDETKI